jgi:hypothetical protein
MKTDRENIDCSDLQKSSKLKNDKNDGKNNHCLGLGVQEHDRKPGQRDQNQWTMHEK